MRVHQTPPALLQLVATLLFTPQLSLAAPNPAPTLGAVPYEALFGRDSCAGTLCGYYSQLCCSTGSACYTDAASIATCTATADGDGYYSYYTTTFTETDTTAVLTTQVDSTYIASASTTAAAISCPATEPSCGSICCASDQYCYSSGQCTALIGGGSGSASATEYTATTHATTSATGTGAVVGTSSVETTAVATVSPTTTVPFVSPVATGSNITVSSQSSSNHHLSGGAIAGIVIGVLLGLALLALIIFCCCIRGLIDGVLAIFGLGGRRRTRTTEVEEYERRSHHASGGRASAGRTGFFGGAVARPAARVEKKEESHEVRNLLGLGVGLAALWTFLGLKRRREERRQEDDKYTEYSYDSQYYTSASSASSDDRRTRVTRDTRYSRR